jgi:thiol-disulfide isomerase/thioredoxin
MAKFFPKIPRWVVGVTISIVLVFVLYAFFVAPSTEAFAGEVTVTYYFLEQCPWCKKFAPEWESFKKAAATEKLSIKTVEVDAEKESDKVPKDIKGFPTVHIAKADGAAVGYDGDRTATALLAEVKKHL